MISLPNASFPLLSSPLSSTALRCVCWRCQRRNIIKYERTICLPSTGRSSPQFAAASPSTSPSASPSLSPCPSPPPPPTPAPSSYLSGRQAHMRVLWPAPSSVSVLFSFCFFFCFYSYFVFFCMAQASSTVRILALWKSFALPRPLLRTPYSCPAKRINGADNGRGTWRLWEMST